MLCRAVNSNLPYTSSYLCHRPPVRRLLFELGRVRVDSRPRVARLAGHALTSCRERPTQNRGSTKCIQDLVCTAWAVHLRTMGADIADRATSTTHLLRREAPGARTTGSAFV